MSTLDRIIEKGTAIVVKLFRINMKQNTKQTLQQFIKFGIVGLSNTALSYAIYYVCWHILNSLGFTGEPRYLTAQVIAFVIGVLWSFYWNNKMVFRDRDGKAWQALGKAFVSYSFTGLFLSNILLVLWVNVLKIPELVAPILNLLISVPINFLLNKYWAFK